MSPSAVTLLKTLSLVSLVSATNTWFSFGDSYTQTGFNVTTGPLPSLENPIGNPPYPGWTIDGLPNWVDFATATFNKTTVLTYNFAYGGD